MKNIGRYDTSLLVEHQYEPGSHGRVLKNKLGIKTKLEMDALEKKELIRTMEEAINLYKREHCFKSFDICKIHQIWLSNIYEWAGKYRQVNISKGDFYFAAAAQVPKLMNEFEKGLLRKFTPCRFASNDKIAEAIGAVHTELILIHPFREGNGRVARILASLMAAQAGLPLLDFSAITGARKKKYIEAVHAGMMKKYTPMKKIFEYVIRRTLQTRGQEK